MTISGGSSKKFQDQILMMLDVHRAFQEED